MLVGNRLDGVLFLRAICRVGSFVGLPDSRANILYNVSICHRIDTDTIAGAFVCVWLISILLWWTLQGIAPEFIYYTFGSPTPILRPSFGNHIFIQFPRRKFEKQSLLGAPLSLRFVVPRLGMRQREAAQKLCLYILELCVRNVYICTSHINIFKSVCLFPEAFAYQNVAHQKGKKK